MSATGSSLSHRVDAAIRRHLDGRCSPPRLGTALDSALFPGGARVRPRFALGIAMACGDDRPRVADAAAAAVEFLHTASLVHDDLPCFDDAPLRRGAPAIHVAHGEALAVLTGDALIVLSFQALSDVAGEAGERLPFLLATLAAAAGTPSGLVAGQALESEPFCDVAAYHAAKTGALFEAAAVMGATAAGADAAPWRPVGARLGAAYQVADDLHDALRLGGGGKPTGQDAAHDRPSAVKRHGIDGAVRVLKDHISGATDAIPCGPMADALRTLVREQTARFLPESLATRFGLDATA